MNNPLVYQAIGVLLVLGYLGLLWMCWKTWRLPHVAASLLVFLSAVIFLAFASFVLKTHAAWRDHYESYSAALEAVRAENVQLRHGDLEELHQTEDSIRSLRGRLGAKLVDRGRVWRGCEPLERVEPANDEDAPRLTYRLRIPRPAAREDLEVEAPEPAEGPGIAPGTVVYVFTERPLEDAIRVPDGYVGEFSVTDSDGDIVTIAAMLPPDEQQIEAMEDQDTTWVLYDVAPLDSHHAFAVMDEEERRMVGMDREALTEFFPNRYDWSEERYEQFLERFTRFNREATDEDPPENVWVLVEFVRDHEIQVDSDLEQSLLDEGGRFYDSSGRALELHVRRGEDGTVHLEEGDTAVFDRETADTLIGDGICRQIRLLYRRSLSDYGFAFRDIHYRHLDLDVEIARATRDRDTMVALRDKSEEQLALLQREQANLEADLAGFEEELELLHTHHEELEERWARTRARLSELFRANVYLANEVTRLQIEMARQIDQRTREATASISSP